MKILDSRTHGYLDYLTVLAFAVAPSLLGFTGTPATVSYALAVIHLSMTLLTAYPLGAVKVIPFPIHGMVELFVGALLVAAPYLLGFAREGAARNFFAASGIVTLVVFLITDYKNAR